MENTAIQEKPGLKELFQQKSYMTLLTANIISRFGDSIDSIAYEWMVYLLTGSKLLMGALLAVNILPNILFSVFSGVLVDYFSKKKAVIVGYIGRGIIVCTVAALYLTGYLLPWHLFVLTFATSTLETFAAPAERTMIQMLLPKNLFLGASSFSTSATTFSQLVGLAAAGLLIGVIGISGAIFIDGLTFFTACLLITLIKIENDNSSKETLTPKVYMNNLKEGFKFMRNHALIIITISMGALINFCLSPFNVLQPAYVKDILAAGPEGMSIIGMGFMGGMVVGGLAAGQFGSRFKKSHLITTGFAAIGICYALLSIPGTITISFIPPLALAFIFCFIFGFFIPVANSPISAYIFTNTPSEMMGRVSSMMGMVMLCAIPLGSALAGVVAQYVSIPVLFLSMGLIIFISAFLPILNKQFRTE